MRSSADPAVLAHKGLDGVPLRLLAGIVIVVFVVFVVFGVAQARKRK
ncbi:hypothetical protein [Streptomyces sp. NPDC058632]